MKIKAKKTTPHKDLTPSQNIPFIQKIKSTRKTSSNSPITLREGECLSWAAVGKTANEIAEILSISEHTIHFHTKNAIKKLDAANKTHAVVIAILARYIVIN